MLRCVRQLKVLDEGRVETTQRADAARNRARILDAARTLIGQHTQGSHPSDALCMDQVAALAGVGKGTLYRRFPDRGALLFALLDDDERVLQDRVLTGCGVKRSAPPLQHLLALLDALTAFHVTHAALLAVAELTPAIAEHPAYRWRHAALTHALARTGIAPVARAQHVTDVVLQILSGAVVSRALGHQDARAVRAQTAALLRAVIKPARVKALTA